jgi:hypothetical protein
MSTTADPVPCNGTAEAAIAAANHVHAPAARSASVALDIGAGRGALVLYPGERFRGLEIEISRCQDGADGRRVHTGVHERTTESGSSLTAIFGSLPAAEYIVWEDATTPGTRVTVPDGSVAELRLP